MTVGVFVVAKVTFTTPKGRPLLDLIQITPPLLYQQCLARGNQKSCKYLRMFVTASSDGLVDFLKIQVLLTNYSYNTGTGFSPYRYF